MSLGVVRGEVGRGSSVEVSFDSSEISDQFGKIGRDSGVS